MTYKEIYIDEQLIDIGSGDITCPITYQLVDIRNLNNRAGSRTKSVGAPRTAKNDRIFGIAADINATNRFDKYSPHSVRIEEATEVIFEGLCKLARVTPSTIEFFCYAELSAFKGISGTKTLQDLRLNDLDHPYDETIFDTWDGTYPTYVAADYIYAPIDYGQFWTRSLTQDPEITDIAVVDMFPSVYVRRIVNQICLDNGFTLVSSFFDDVQNSKLAVPFTNEQFVHSPGYFTQTQGFEGYTNSNSPYALPLPIASYNLPITTEVFDPLDQWHQFDREYTADANQRASVRFRGYIDFTGGGHNTSDIVFNFIVEKYTLLTTTWASVRTYPMSFTGAIQYVDWTNDVTLATGDKIRFRLERITLGIVGTKEAIIYAENVQITPQPLGGNLILQDETVQLAPNLPDIKQIDFITWCYKMFNWVIDINAKQGVMYIETYDTYYGGADVVDMSRKLNLAIEPIIEYDDVLFARKYDFEYTPDTDDFYLTRQNGLAQAEASLNFGDGKLYLTEQGESTLIGKVGFSPSVVGATFTNVLDLPVMITLDGSVTTAPETITKHSPRIGIVVLDTLVTTLSDSAVTTIYVEDAGGTIGKTSLPLFYFQKRQYGDTALDIYSQNLAFALSGTTDGFAGSVVWNGFGLISTYYESSIKNLSTSASVTAWFNLNPNDLAGLNFGTKWYVDYFESQFRLGRIVDYQPGRLAPTKCELIKVSAYINPRSLDTLT